MFLRRKLTSILSSSRPSLMSSSPSVAARLISSEFKIIVTEPSENKSQDIDRNFAVLLFGFAGSSYKQLEKHSILYNNLGYKTLHCILPIKHHYHYDIPRIVDCSRQVWMKNLFKSNFIISGFQGSWQSEIREYWGCCDSSFQ